MVLTFAKPTQRITILKYNATTHGLIFEERKECAICASATDLGTLTSIAIGRKGRQISHGRRSRVSVGFNVDQQRVVDEIVHRPDALQSKQNAIVMGGMNIMKGIHGSLHTSSYCCKRQERNEL